MPSSTLIGSLGPVIGAILGAILAAAFSWYRSRIKPHYLVFEEQARTPLEVIEEAREETEISYGGSKVDRLSLEKIRLFNHGPKVLKDADFTVTLNPGVKIVGTPQPKIMPRGEGKIVSPSQEQPPNQNEKKFHIDYLKPFKPYKQEVIIDLICDGEITDVGVSGGGPEWSAIFWSLEEKRRRIGRTFVLPYLLFILLNLVLMIWSLFVPMKGLAGDMKAVILTISGVFSGLLGLMVGYYFRLWTEKS